MLIRTVLSILSGLLAALSYFPYGLAIWRKQTKPCRATWLIWSMLDIVIWLGMFAKNAQTIQMSVVAVGTLIIAILALRHGKPGWSRIDIFCMACSCVGIILLFLANPIVGLLVGLVVMVIGSIPTFISSWQDPTRENRTGWLLSWLSSFCATLAIPSLTIADAAQPITFLSMGSVMMYVLFLRNKPTPEA